MKLAIIGYGCRMTDVIHTLLIDCREKIEIVGITDPVRERIINTLKKENLWYEGLPFL